VRLFCCRSCAEEVYDVGFSEAENCVSEPFEADKVELAAWVLGPKLFDRQDDVRRDAVEQVVNEVPFLHNVLKVDAGLSEVVRHFGGRCFDVQGRVADLAVALVQLTTGLQISIASFIAYAAVRSHANEVRLVPTLHNFGKEYLQSVAM
jgi:hypothetical protein